MSATPVARSARHGPGPATHLRLGGAATDSAASARCLRQVRHHRSNSYGDRAGSVRIRLIVPLLLLLVGRANAQSAGRLDAVLRAQRDSGFAGVVLVARGDSIVFEKAYSQPTAKPLTLSSKFNIGSMTKGFTAAAILSLRSQHRLSFSDPISRFFPHAPDQKRDITVFHLLTHTSGLASHSAGAGIMRRDGAVTAILSQRLEYPPGTHYRYADDDYQLLAAIIEMASGETWERYVDRELLAPTRMRSTTFQGGDWGHKGANGMRSTARDIYRWITAIHDARLFGRTESRELESPLMHVRSEPPFEIHYGYGTRVYVRNGRVAEVMHSGSGDARNTSVARVLADGTILIVLSNAGQRRGTTWASYVAQRLVPRR